MERAIVHMDLDTFFVSCDRLGNSKLEAAIMARLSAPTNSGRSQHNPSVPHLQEHEINPAPARILSCGALYFNVKHP